ncbi:MAG: hypothetical protein QOG64_2786, partial [Acidimicrobiaceae bacterium]|nr:hypothetical protein [Acidimicrobiaceae bacterium]
MEPTEEGVAPHAQSRVKSTLFYAVVAVVAVVALLVVINIGGSLHAPRAGKSEVATGAAGSAEKVIWRLLLASVVILVVARAVGGLFQRINQPQVVGEIVAGILLGPSVLGAIWPGATSYLFPTSVLPFIDALSQVG